ncbi:MAG: hypothetical protein ABI874_03275 [Chloroflexota bacterium]
MPYYIAVFGMIAFVVYGAYGNPRGWAQRFRNTDDAYTYQAELVTNAWFQSMYAPQFVSAQKCTQSFEWMLRQTPPDGLPLAYNPSGEPWAITTAYLGASMLRDPRYIWLAANSLSRLEERNGFLSAQPGVEAPLDMRGSAPTEGACLLYGDSGLPNQVGPLAPDKIVLRDGWSADSNYLLLNLRFMGWHRYKATNDIVALNQAEPLVVEQAQPNPIWWLPRGRSVERDKRIAREYLNGLLIPATGVSGLFGALGIGDGWAQDPPLVARVLRFEPNATPQVAQTVIDDWHGWTHTRTIYFYPRGPIVVVDTAAGGSGRAALSWHILGDGVRAGDGL